MAFNIKNLQFELSLATPKGEAKQQRLVLLTFTERPGQLKSVRVIIADDHSQNALYAFNESTLRECCAAITEGCEDTEDEIEVRRALRNMVEAL